MTRKELIKSAGIKSGGLLSKRLEELEESGFITRYQPFGQKSYNSVFRLSDFYSFFYLKFIKNNRNYNEGIWLNAIDHPAQRSWAGFAFEQICLAHVSQIKKALGINGVVTNALSWKSKTSENGSQIDLLIDRRDQVINLCEVKYSINPYKISKEYADNLRNKIGVFRTETKTNKTIFLTMITTFGLQRNAHAVSVMQNDLEMGILFDGG